MCYSMWHINAPIAQLVEHRTLNPQVVGSIPTGGTIVKHPSCSHVGCFTIADNREKQLLVFRSGSNGGVMFF